MSAKSEAEAFDAREMPVEAADAYERAVAASEADIEVYLDLIVLYLVCQDFGYLSHHRLTNEFIDRASSRIPELLTEAARRFGPHNEIEFWHYYASYFHGTEPQFQKCLELARRGPSLVPYFHLFALPDGEGYSREAQEVLHSVAGGKTERERYIKSVLESTFNARRQERKKKDRASKRFE